MSRAALQTARVAPSCVAAALIDGSRAHAVPTRRCADARRCAATPRPCARLIEQGADVNAAQGDGMTALHWAAMNGDAETVRRCCSPARTSSRDAPGRLHAAAPRERARPRRRRWRGCSTAGSNAERGDRHRRAAADLAAQAGNADARQGAARARRRRQRARRNARAHAADVRGGARTASTR